MKGTEIVAKVEASLTGENTIRHNLCDLLIPTGKKNRCSKCEANRKSLLVMLKRHNSATTSSDPSSHTNYRYLTTPLLNERCSNLHKNYIASQRQVTKLKAQIEKLSTDGGVVVSSDLNDDLKDIMKQNFSDIAKQYPEKSFQKMFWDQHAKTSACQDARGFRWHPAMIRWCLYLRHLSGKAYETLRCSGILNLPSQRTLRDYTHYIPETIGFSPKVDEMLMDTMKVKYKKPIASC